MRQFEKLYETAASNYGLVTTADAQGLGIHRKELLKWAKIGRLERCGRGVFRIMHYIPTSYDQYAEAVALVGGNAIVYGDSVLAMHNLALVNPRQVKIATDRRIRRNLPGWISVVPRPTGTKQSDFQGIASQDVAGAIRVCEGIVMPDRLLSAVDDAERDGLIARREAEELRGDLKR